jgi:hypothetical protein
MTTSPNSSAEAWTKMHGTWTRRWSGGYAFASVGGSWVVDDNEGRYVNDGERDSAIAAMEAADLAIAELERKG